MVLDSDQFLTFFKMTLEFISLPPECLFMSFKHRSVYIGHNYAILRFFRNILKSRLSSIVSPLLKKGWTWYQFRWCWIIKHDNVEPLRGELRPLVPDLMFIITKLLIFQKIDQLATSLTQKGWVVRLSQYVQIVLWYLFY